MDAASQQKILGYFIEEAKEHLETIEQGILELRSATDDAEQINEMFRAAHSVKGGAAMLGYVSIQKTAHRLEDAFKVLKEHEMQVDQKLESLFLKGYDTLQELINQLQGPFGLRDEDAEKITKGAESHFSQLQKYLNQIVTGEVPPPASSDTVISTFEEMEVSSFGMQSRELLEEMLSLFKHKATPQGRKKIQGICVRLAKLSSEAKKWQTLAKAAHRAVGNPKHPYRTLAPIVIKELKQGSDLIELDQEDQITLGEGLKRLAEAKSPQVLVPVEPKAAAKLLKQAFNQKQIAQLIQLLGSK